MKQDKAREAETEEFTLITSEEARRYNIGLAGEVHYYLHDKDGFKFVVAFVLYSHDIGVYLSKMGREVYVEQFETYARVKKLMNKFIKLAHEHKRMSKEEYPWDRENVKYLKNEFYPTKE